jgi:transcription elongation GreA/GreB family factor
MSAGASPGIGAGVVEVGSRVLVRDDDGERELVIVDAADADAPSGRISSDCPLGLALIGSAAGDRVVVRAPAGRRAVSVVEVMP